nr:uncharacterized protein LOC124810457 isoform X2 [Hydra vulgaris]
MSITTGFLLMSTKYLEIKMSSVIDCVLCNKKDVQSYGLKLGNGQSICKECASCSNNILNIDEFVGRAFQKFSTEKLREIASSTLLKSVFKGQLYSYRHNLYKAGGDEKRYLCDIDLVDLLSDEQQHALYSAFATSYNELKLNDYVLKVLVPEAIIYLFAKTEQISRIKAEVILNSYISKGINERDQESESSINDGSVVSAENFFIHLLQKKEQQKNSRLMKWAQYDSCIKETNTTLVNEKKELPEQSELKINMTLFNEDFESNEGVVQCLLNDLVEKVCAYVDDSIDFIKQDYPKTKSYANEASFTLTVQENIVNCTMDLLCAKKNIFHHKCDVADVTEVKRISSKLGSQIHTIVNNNNIKNNYTKHHSEDTQKPSSQLVNKRTKHKSAEKPKRNKKLCPIPGCGAKVVNLPRHIKLSKKSDHLLLKKSASKVVSIFGLRNSKSNNADIHYRKKMRICPVDGCFSVILNLSDHFKKSHSELFNNTELYGKMRNKATVMIGYEEEKIVSIFKSNNRESEDSSTHLESDSSESNCSEYKKFIYKTDSLYSESLPTDSDSEYNVEGDKQMSL